MSCLLLRPNRGLCSKATTHFNLYRQHDDAWRFHGIFCRQEDTSMVTPSIKIRPFWSQNSKVPLKQVVLKWLGMVHRGGVS